MTTELIYLTLVAVLTASLWIPFIVGVNVQKDVYAGDFTRPPDVSKFAPWIHRAHRAHLNAVEQVLPFAVLVLLLNSIGVSTSWTVGASVAFFWLRLAHAVGMITGLARFPVRPILFTAGWICILILGWQAFAA